MGSDARGGAGAGVGREHQCFQQTGSGELGGGGAFIANDERSVRRAHLHGGPGNSADQTDCVGRLLAEHSFCTGDGVVISLISAQISCDLG